MTFLFYLTTILFVFVCLLLILLVLIQKGRGGGLSGAFGGAGGNTAFGSKTGDVLTWATSILFGVFLLLAVGLNLLAEKRNRAETERENAFFNQPEQPAPQINQPTLPKPETPTSVPASVPSVAPTNAPSTLPSTQP